MKFYIHKNTLNTNKSNSGKAIFFTHSYGGFNTGKEQVWFPLSQLEIDKFNDVGWAKVNIPDWLLKQKGYLNSGSLKGNFEELECSEE